MSKTSYFNCRQMSYIDMLSHYLYPFCMLQLLLAYFMLLYSIVGNTFYVMLTATAEKAKEVNNKPIMVNLIKNIGPLILLYLPTRSYIQQGTIIVFKLPEQQRFPSQHFVFVSLMKTFCTGVLAMLATQLFTMST